MRTKIRLLTLLVLMFAGSTLFAQDKAISGVVKDNTGAELSGATVSVKGTANSVMTDAKGKFTIKAGAKATIVVSFVGFQSKEAAVNGLSTVNFSLEPGTSALTDVVVTSLGITKKQKALGYATTMVSAEQITDAGTPNFATALYGKAPGVRIAATPGGATSAVNINIRGINSVNGKNDPLIVMDGIPIRNGEVKNNDYWSDQRLRGNGLLDIQTEDIENISILKGASAAALYGSEAVNGVVLITTKQASKNRKGLGVDVSTNYSIDNVAYLPKYQNVRGYGISNTISNGGQDDNGFVWWDLNNDGIKETRSLGSFSINYGPKFDGQPILNWDGRILPYSAQPNNYDALFQTAHNSSVNVAVSKASDNANIRFSLTRQENEGVSMGSKSEKNSMNLNTSFRLSPKFSTDVMINYVNQTIKNRPYSIDRMINNFTGMIGRFDNGEWYMNKAVTSKGYRYRTGTQQSATPSENILYNGFKGDIADYAYRVQMHQLKEESNRVIASMTNNYSILTDLKLRTRLATDFTSAKEETRQPNEVPLAFGNSGYFGLGQTQNTILYGDVLMTYTKKINSDLELNAMTGYTATKETMTRTSRGTNGGLSTENLYDVAASVNTANSGSARSSLVKEAFIGTFNASYKDYLFVEATVRRDRVSVMNPNQNSFTYPSVNSSFIFSDALKMPSWLSYGKIRGSWGIVGNYPDQYAANVAYNQGTLGSQGGNPVLFTNISSNFGNDAIRNEKKKEFEFGIETRLFKNRVTFEASYYNAQVVDQILPLSLPATTGATSILANVGTLRNTGIEVTISGYPIKKANFSWETGINLSQNQNKVEKLAPGLNELLHADYDGNAAQLKSVVGQPMGDFYAHPVLKNAKGEMIVNPDGTYALDANNMYKVGNAMPKVIGGWFNTVKYKNFSFDAMIDFRFGGYVMPTGIYWMISRGLLEESLEAMDKEHGGLSYYKDKTSGKYVQSTATAGPQGEKIFNDGMLLPGVKADGSKNDYLVPQSYYFWNTYNWGGPQYSSSRYELYIQKNSYIKMREVTLGYTMPTKVASMIGAKKLQFSVFGRNLFYIYRTLKHLDAEQTTAGSRWFQNLNNAGGNPSTRSFGVMLRATF
jgi:TonB-linked SusC/RagA family outer membrane protein